MKQNKSKMKVLDLQELAHVDGGKGLEEAGAAPQAWSTISRGGCFPQQQDEWSTASAGCA